MTDIENQFKQFYFPGYQLYTVGMTVYSTSYVPADEVRGSCGVCAGWGHYSRDCPKAKGSQRKLSVAMFARPHLISGSSESEGIPPSGDPDGIQIIHSPPPPNSDVSIWLQETVVPPFRHTNGSVPIQQSVTPVAHVVKSDLSIIRNGINPLQATIQPTHADIAALVKEELISESQRLQQAEKEHMSERARYTAKLSELCEKEKIMQNELTAAVDSEKAKCERQVEMLIEKQSRLELEMQIKIEEAHRTAERNAEAHLLQRQEELNLSNRKLQSDLEILHEKQEQAALENLLRKEKENTDTEVALQTRIAAAEEAESIKNNEMDVKQLVLQQKADELQQIESNLSTERSEMEEKILKVTKTETDLHKQKEEIALQEETLKQLSGKLQEEGLSMQSTARDLQLQRQEVLQKDTEFTQREITLKELNTKLHEMQICLEDRNSALDLRERELASKIQHHQEQVTQQQESLSQQMSKIKEASLEADLYSKEQRDGVETYRQITEQELSSIRESLTKQEEITKSEQTTAQQNLLASEKALNERMKFDVELKRRIAEAELKENSAGNKTLELQKQIEELEQKTASMRTLKDTITSQQQSLSTAAVEVDDQKKSAERHLREAEQVLQSAHQRSAELDHEQAEFRGQTQDLASAKQKIASLRKQIHIATTDVEEKELECHGYRLKCADIETQLSEAVAAKRTSDSTALAAQQENASLKTEASQIHKKLKELNQSSTSQIEEKVLEINNHLNKLTNLENINNKLTTQISDYQSTITKHNFEMSEVKETLKQFQESGKPWPLNPILLSSSDMSAPRTIPAVVSGISPHSSEWSKLDISTSVSPCDSPLIEKVWSVKYAFTIENLCEDETKMRSEISSQWETEICFQILVWEIFSTLSSDPPHMSASAVTSPTFRIDRSPQSPSIPFSLSLPPLPSSVIDNSDNVSIGSKISFSSKENSDPKLLLYAVTTDMHEVLHLHSGSSQLKRISDICVTTTKRFERLCEDYEQSRRNVAFQSSKAHQYKAEQWYVDSHLHTVLEDNQKTNKMLQEDQENYQWLESQLQQATNRLVELETEHEGCGSAFAVISRSEQHLSICLNRTVDFCLLSHCFNALTHYYLDGIRYRLGKVERDALRNLQQENRRHHLSFRYHKWISYVDDIG